MICFTYCFCSFKNCEVYWIANFPELGTSLFFINSAVNDVRNTSPAPMVSINLILVGVKKYFFPLSIISTPFLPFVIKKVIFGYLLTNPSPKQVNSSFVAFRIFIRLAISFDIEKFLL